MLPVSSLSPAAVLSSTLLVVASLVEDPAATSASLTISCFTASELPSLALLPST